MSRLRLSFSSLDLGVIIAWPSGVTYSNQANGVACEHPELEGVFYPIATKPIHFGPQNAELSDFVLENRDGNRGPLSEIIADFIDDFLKRTDFPFSAVVDRNHLPESVEAWVWLTLTRSDAPSSSLFVGYDFDSCPLFGALVWENSD